MHPNMKMTMSILAVLSITTGLTSAAPTCETTFNPVDGFGDPVNGGAWDDPDNWDSGTPTPTKVACIPAGKTATISTTTEFAEALWIKTDATDGPGKVTIFRSTGNGSLTLYANSTIDGDLELWWASQLLINTSITIDGEGEISLKNYSSTFSPTIDGVGGIPHTLTLTGAGTGAWDDRTDSLVLEGSGDINVHLVNNAHVIATYAAVDLFINEDSSGTGFWIAEEDGDVSEVGILDVKATINGLGTFVVNHSTASVRINSADTASDMDVLVIVGEFLVRENFETTGFLDIEAGGRAVVRQGKVAIFNK